jgi:hypothetical protein
MKSSPRIIYTPRLDAAPEAELNTLAACYRFILDCHAKKRGRLPDKSGPDDTERSENACAENKYTR